MQYADLIETVRTQIYKILYKWGYKVGHLIAKIGSWSFLEGIRNAFSRTISEEMNINLAADSFASVFDTVATSTVQSLTSEIIADIEGNWSTGELITDENLQEWEVQALEELHIERTVEALKSILSDPLHALTIATIHSIEAQVHTEAHDPSVSHAIDNYNENKPLEAKEILANASIRDHEVSYFILDKDGNTLHEVIFTREQTDEGEWYLELVP